ncbi:hypothetical protein OWV82_017111 [Melia azedarach]|uniref:Uncharacterized protein n=1 Tax=Melia azedarach TaxID=155640 RepID=A0ACC1XHW3_MELAZ|nr:hypothetical protein OWV82_017111 [Melia azedarach]
MKSLLLLIECAFVMDYLMCFDNEQSFRIQWEPSKIDSLKSSVTTNSSSFRTRIRLSSPRFLVFNKMLIHVNI